MNDSDNEAAVEVLNRETGHQGNADLKAEKNHIKHRVEETQKC